MSISLKSLDTRVTALENKKFKLEYLSVQESRINSNTKEILVDIPDNIDNWDWIIIDNFHDLGVNSLTSNVLIPVFYLTKYNPYKHYYGWFYYHQDLRFEIRKKSSTQIGITCIDRSSSGFQRLYLLRTTLK